VEKIIYANGTAEVLVPAGQKIAIATYGNEYATISFKRGNNLEFIQRLDNAQVTLGPWTDVRTVNIEAAQDPVSYDVGTAPNIDSNVRMSSNPLTGEIWISSGGRGIPGATSIVPSIANFDVFDLYPITARRKLSLPTPYSAVGPEVVHPSVVYIPEGWGGWKYWMAYTPYPVINSDYENPCLAVSNDGDSNWTTPAGLTNPLAGKPANGYNADTHLVMAPDYSKLYMIYRERSTGASAGNRVKLMESADGRKWTDPVTIITGTYAVQDYASPSLWFDPTISKWVMISHNLDGGATYPMQLTQSLTADLYGGWAAPQTITITNPTAGRTFWHSAFNRLPDGRVIGLIQDIVNGGAGAAGQLFAAESLDGGATFAVRRVYADLGTQLGCGHQD